MRRRRDLPVGIYKQDGGAFRTIIYVRSVPYTQRWPKDTTIQTMKDWIAETRGKAITAKNMGRGPVPAKGTFRSDAQRYLEAVAAMPTYQERKMQIDWWCETFGERQRRTIESDEIRAQLHRLKAEGKAAATVNKYRTSLQHLFTVLDGKSAANPVKDVPKFSEPSPLPRGMDYGTLAVVFRGMPQSPERARLKVLAYTGIPHAQLAQIAESDVNFEAGTVSVHGRKKGKGTRARVVPLQPLGVQAFKEMQREEAWGPFSRWLLRRRFRDACLAASVTPMRTYDLRHSFGTAVYAASGDIGATQELMGHSTAQLTWRYAMGAVAPRVRAAVESVGKYAGKYGGKKSGKSRVSVDGQKRRKSK